MQIVIIAGFLIVILLIVGGVVTIVRRQSFVDERLEKIFDEDNSFAVAAEAEASTSITDWFNERVEKTKRGSSVARDLARAGLPMKPGEYFSLMGIAALSLAGLGYLWGGVVGAIIGFPIGLFIPRSYVKRQQNKRLALFNNQLPDMLNLMVNGLRAGYSTMQALEAVSKELPAPVSDEFRRVVREMQLGIPMEDALDNLFRRIESDDLDLIITAINIQREVGGNLAEIMDIIAFTIRERIRIKREIQTLVAQVMYSGRTLAIMPIALAVFLWFINREYMEQFFLPETRNCGIPILVTGGLMVMAGYFAMNKVADIEV